ncbi:hypothetical protein CNO08_16195 [Lysobacter capsici]|nr:hypothetical protein CNO08_16195 [Lysobacter capsici]
MAVAAARRDAACGGEMNRHSPVRAYASVGHAVRAAAHRPDGNCDGASGREPARNLVETRRIASVRGPADSGNRRAVPAVAAVAILPNRSLRKGMP